MPLILNEDGTVYADVPSLTEMQLAFQDEIAKIHDKFINSSYADAISVITLDIFMEICYDNFQNNRREESDSRKFVQKETQARRSHIGTDGRAITHRVTKALPMGAIVGAGRRVEEETS
jgi:hypothetical protein